VFKRTGSNEEPSDISAVSSRTTVALSGIVAVLLALGIIAAATFTGIPVAKPTTNTTQSLSTIQSSSSSSPGTLALLITDPPNIPKGVTKLYISYDNLQIHSFGPGQSSIWIPVDVKGNIELLGTINVSQTIASFHLSSGKYDLIRFNVSSATVTYSGKNFTAFVVHNTLFVPFQTAVQVSNSRVSAAIIDIHPNVLNIGSKSHPELIIKTEAKGFVVPSSEVNYQTEHEGHRESLIGKPWWTNIQENSTAKLRIIGATLTSNSLTVTAKNVGTQPTMLRLVVVSPLAALSPEDSADTENHSPLLLGSTVFGIMTNGSLTPISALMHTTGGESDDRANVANAIFLQSGYNLTAGASVQLTYDGPMILGFGMNTPNTVSIAAGQQYLITVIGEQSLASFVVVAG
jgi:hypothetical protein